jgi:alkanesulfonate monooxygenase SsuD/methylene tetrahydromethanopterin reductase-like flavin-dependent oxidoreductase (luciferase family)
VTESVPVGVFIPTATAPERIAPLAASAERRGFGEVWVAEDCFLSGGFSAAALALSATSAVKVGLGVVATVTRHPAITAMEIATLAGAHPGRFLPGIGHGIAIWTDQMDITPRSPLSALRESVTTTRDLLAGKTVDVEGKQFTLRSIQLSHPPSAEVPILTGVLGRKSLELSGEVADGTVVSILAGTKYLEFAKGAIEAGMRASGRTSHLLPTFALLSIAKDGRVARDAMRPTLGTFLSVLGPRNGLTAPYGYNEHLAELIDKGGPEVVAREMPDEWIDELTLSGDPDEVAAGIQRLHRAGATSVLLSPVNPALEEDIELVADTVLPQLA